MTVGQLRALLDWRGLTDEQEVLVWDADVEDRRIVALKFPIEPSEPLQLITEE